MGDKDLERFRQHWREEITEQNRAAGPTSSERSSNKRRKRGRGPGPGCHGDGVAADPGPGCQGDGAAADPGLGCHGDEAAADPGGPELGHENSGGGPEVERPSGRHREAPGGADYFYLAESLLEGRTSPLRERLEGGRCGGTRGTGPADKPSDRFGQTPSNRREDLLDQLINDLNEINEIPFFDIDLPYELAMKIFAYLGKTELGRCAQVSKAWKVIAEDEVLWYKHCLKAGYQVEADIGDFTCWKAVLRDSVKKEQTLRANWKNRIGAASQLQYDVGGILCDAHSCNGLVISGYTSGDVRMWDISTWDSSALNLETSRSSAELGPRPHVSFVRINSTIAVAAYKGGAVDVWSTVVAREPVHHYQHCQEIQAVAVASDSAAIATCSGYQVRLESSDERGYWRRTYQFELQKLVSYLQLVPGVAVNSGENQPLVAAAEDTVYLLNPDTEPKVQVYCLQTSQPLATLGNSAGDFTCVNLKDSPPYLAVTGNKDRKVRVYDLRTSKEVISLYGHQLGVSSVQMDDWKIVSGGEEGLVCVWEQRMGTKLWEMHSRHPVRHLRFGAHTLVTANIPDEKCPRGASIMDDDLTAHRRHRGIIYVYDFSIDKSAPVLPICRSTYDEDVGYSYNIALSMPYDQIK
ncbi:F-box/WD repeat-containing protein 8 isoform X2 [Scyliorhinus canicula]|uniref:F-box/WD repeat-containing protein 8 isoform X2 n=1 Tax=Scyliorhinus canicula TaxID=7830 RepID=UPI0018F6E459|nr:F-box/WD repeat-containing protein 8 isoform X2 [Scyliorhinus canicula]